MIRRISLAGVHVDLYAHKDELSRQVTGWLLRPEKSRQIVTLNARMLMTALNHPRLAETINKADLVTIDGFGIELAIKKRGYAQIVRIAGIDLVKELLAWGSFRQLPVFFYGGSREVVRHLRSNVPQRWPGLEVRGIWDGYGIELEREQVQQEIIRCQPRLLLVGLGTPFQELFLGELLPRLPRTVGIGVGGALEVLTGVKVEVPLWLRHCGGEWFFRMLQEPRKLNGLPDLIRFWLRFLR
ncbi:MAG TPA: WecB/TagA/CpsF family glycosyltransferase [Bacillota bacterium]|nr:WecB/TagA/CpsF family glycosyltransferase [Bacillota bacterium]